MTAVGVRVDRGAVGETGELKTVMTNGSCGDCSDNQYKDKACSVLAADHVEKAYLL
jgi:hypothetical protein